MQVTSRLQPFFLNIKRVRQDRLDRVISQLVIRILNLLCCAISAPTYYGFVKISPTYFVYSLFHNTTPIIYIYIPVNKLTWTITSKQTEWSRIILNYNVYNNFISKSVFWNFSFGSMSTRQMYRSKKKVER